MTDAPRVAAIVLAAGQGARFAAQADGAFKLLALLDGQSLVRHAAQAALKSCASPVVVVTGHKRVDVRDALAGLDFIEAHNPDYASGLSSSLRVGLAALPADADAALVLLGDMPRVTSELLDRLIDAFARNPAADAVIPVHASVRGNPVLLARRLFDAASRVTGDQGARKMLSAAAHVIEIAIDEASVALDIDTPDALADVKTF